MAKETEVSQGDAGVTILLLGLEWRCPTVWQWQGTRRPGD